MIPHKSAAGVNEVEWFVFIKPTGVLNVYFCFHLTTSVYQSQKVDTAGLGMTNDDSTLGQSSNRDACFLEQRFFSLYHGEDTVYYINFKVITSKARLSTNVSETRISCFPLNCWLYM